MEIAMSKASDGSSNAHLFDVFFGLSAKALCVFARRLTTPRATASDRKVRSGFRTIRCDKHSRQHVGRFNDFMLKDIGLTRADLLSASLGKGKRRD
jgi:uncharacterized protein YjiS (DUF1127 family)